MGNPKTIERQENGKGMNILKLSRPHSFTLYKGPE
jgi:hypothetical protein